MGSDSHVPDRYLHNAFRVLGLPGSSCQAAIDSAKRRMQIWPDPNRIPPTPYDMASLGPISRTKVDLERAVSRLNEPGTRVLERLFWFDVPAAHSDHAIALNAFYSVLKSDPEFRQADLWAEAVNKLTALTNSPAFLEEQLRIESAGDFEKSARAEEVQSAIKRLPESINDLLVNAAADAVAANDFDRAVRLARLLSPPGSAPLPSSSRQIIDLMEDQLLHRCERIRQFLYTNVKLEPNLLRSNMRANRVATKSAMTDYEQGVEPMLDAMTILLHTVPDREQRVRAYAGRALGFIGIGWVWSGEHVAGEEALIKAIGMTSGTPYEPMFEQERLRNAERARQQRVAARMSSGGIHTAGGVHAVGDDHPRVATISTGQGFRPPEFKAPPRPAYKPKPQSKSSRGWIAIAVGVMALLRVLSSQSDRNPNPTYEPLPRQQFQNYTPPPQATPNQLPSPTFKEIFRPDQTRDPFAPDTNNPRSNMNSRPQPPSPYRSPAPSPHQRQPSSPPPSPSAPGRP